MTQKKEILCYTYGMTIRPFGRGCQPMENLIEAYTDNKANGKYWSYLWYTQKLPEEQARAFALTFIGEEYKEIRRIDNNE